MMQKVYFLRLKLSILLLAPIWTIPLLATHNRAGEITVEQIGDCTESLTIRATIVTYTKASSRPADRDTLTICWGDGQCERVPRANGPGSPPQGIILENDTKFNIYTAFHTYLSRGSYVLSMNDPNRNAGILNVNFPNSDQVKFHIETRYTFPNPQFQGCNNSPVLLQPPIDIGCVGKVFTHNPNAFDSDGDSLSYHKIIPQQDVRLEVPNYQYPDEVSPGANNNLTIDEVTGDIVWDAPQRAGEYNYAIIIVEYRNGIPLDTIIRDMQILIEDCENEPPLISTSVEEICVIAGEVVEIQVVATAPIFESSQRVRLTALGGPFEVANSPATFLPDNNTFQNDPVNKTFRWQTTCDHIFDQYYSVVFRAVDNFFGDSSGLATLKTVRIKVVGPPPEDVRATAGSGQVEVSWKLPYVCEDAADNYFRGFTVWRREGSNNFPIDKCDPGLDGKGYTKLTPVPIKQVLNGRYYYLDPTVDRGRTYCYRILGEFARTTPGGLYTFNGAQSLPSAEVCVQLNRDIPLITNVDVQSTSNIDGSMEVCWSKPQVGDLDTLLNPGPYVYEVLRASGQTDNESDFQAIGVRFTSQYFALANDTCFIDNALNTAGEPYSYKINFYINGDELLGGTNAASSVFLNVTPTDNANRLTWTELVPWDNFQYLVLRENGLGTFDTIATVTESSYLDTGLSNGTNYCYKIVSIGSYGVEGVISPIINDSQVACSTPMDDVPPCPPELTVSNVCGTEIDCSNEDELFNTLAWISPAELCPEIGDDVQGYDIYYAPTETGTFTQIARIDDAFTTTFEHKPESGIAGCYKLVAYDSLGNTSAFSNTFCVDNCPTYFLPNAFTPNGDGQNDLFKPYPFCFIESIQFKVFNRWGQMVFETNDPNINWDGNNLAGKALASGTYYYTCIIFERRVAGITEAPGILSGYIELLRGN
ncbi:MAG: gliding motility-associated C-terminal domain-containing protein [Saprospiraceae bacterium]